ncbi:hypothetical protein CEXT_700711 [Caerostris extrusa]|uniref:Uncharacterized protein n=1 Tax=Caerostris extrusa TaxID=172846 RepID=A0AAV4PYX8_CAEEX|nr:hypothetical protein CEXT_700711 [Caerostris extrusa]
MQNGQPEDRFGKGVRLRIVWCNPLYFCARNMVINILPVSKKTVLHYLKVRFSELFHLTTGLKAFPDAVDLCIFGSKANDCTGGCQGRPI